MTPLLLFVALSAAQAATAPVPAETRCDYLVHGTAGIERRSTPELHILQQTARDRPFTPQLPPGASIECGRTDIVPAQNDWKVLAAGYPLFIVEVTEGNPRVAVLEISNGRVGYSFVSGRMTEAEAPRIQERLNAFQPHFER